jgi:hypothetical protein
MKNITVSATRRVVGLIAMMWLLAASLPAQLQITNPQEGDHPDVVVITITRFGPYPASLTHSSTPFFLSVVNRSGVLQDTLSIVQGAAGAGKDVKLPSLLDLHSTAAKQRDHALICPLPGSYHLVFQSHPDWIVNVTITAN